MKIILIYVVILIETLADDCRGLRQNVPPQSVLARTLTLYCEKNMIIHVLWSVTIKPRVAIGEIIQYDSTLLKII